MSVSLTPANIDQKPILSALMQLYTHELSGITEEEIGLDGYYDLGPYFDAYWLESSRHPFLIYWREALAGFCLVRQTEEGLYQIAEFFVLRTYRRRGVGEDAACLAFSRFAGQWQVCQEENNSAAQHFWRKVISRYTNGDFEEGFSDSEPRGPMQLFRTAAST